MTGFDIGLSLLVVSSVVALIGVCRVCYLWGQWRVHIDSAKGHLREMIATCDRITERLGK